MRPHDIVAIILTVGLMIILISGSHVRCAWMDCGSIRDIDEFSLEGIQVWKEVILVILGALSGYIAGKGNDNKS